MAVSRLARIALTAADPDGLARFYEAALGFERVGEAALPGAVASALFGLPVEEGRVVRLRLGRERFDLIGFTPGGAPYPGDVPGWNPIFQHCAIIVLDMEEAHARLSARSGWRPISTAGPEHLPEASGGVAAFKFRDPEGHPLEFLAFPAGRVPDLWQRPDAPDVCLGIDHSAISVAQTERSVRFYASFGYGVATRSHNVGPEQARMDAVADADVDVTGLSLKGQDAPHVELLCYRGDYDRALPPPAGHDVAATRLVLETDADALASLCAEHADRLVSPEPVVWPDGRIEALLRDPDGHQLVLTARR